MVRRLITRLAELNLTTEVFNLEGSKATCSEQTREQLTQTLLEFKDEQEEEHNKLLDPGQCIEYVAKLLEDLPQNFAELVQLIKVKDRVESRPWKCSSKKKSTRNSLLHRLETHLEANFSQRGMLLFLAEKVLMSFVLLFCNYKVIFSQEA